MTALYGGLAFAGLRIARRVPDLFARLAATGITAWIVVQAVVNIGAVIGVLPPRACRCPSSRRACRHC